MLFRYGFHAVKNAFLVFATMVLSVSCSRHDTDKAPKGTITVAVRNAPTIYYFDREGNAVGPEHDLVNKFAEETGYAVNFKTLESIEDILEELAEGDVDIAAAGLTKTRSRDELFFSSPSYSTIRQQVICGKGIKVKNTKQLVGKEIVIPADSSYVDTLNDAVQEYPNLEWKMTSEFSTEEVLAEVSDGSIQCTVADDHIVEINQRFLPNLTVQYNVSGAQSLVWYIPHDREELSNEVTDWFEQRGAKSKIRAILDRYYGFVEAFDYYDSKVFQRRKEKRLKPLIPFFKEAAEKYDFDWKLIAAVAYQESHWDAQAKSPTGVRGIMMLTQETAKSLGVNDRLDAEKNILAGTEFLRELYDKVPNYIPEPDRLYMALASYNVGYYHLRDARALAVLRDRNPNRWADLQAVLPLLSQKRYYSKLPYGYARGTEPVQYVAHIRNYYELLQRED